MFIRAVSTNVTVFLFCVTLYLGKRLWTFHKNLIFSLQKTEHEAKMIAASNSFLPDYTLSKKPDDMNFY